MTRDEYRQAISGFPGHFALGLEAGHRTKIDRKPVLRTFVCGMGGSALGAELLSAWVGTRPEIQIHRDYGLPSDAGKHALVIAVSYSGSTEETLSAARAAIQAGRRLVVITTGGELAKLAAEHKLPHVALPTGMPPRLSVGAQFGALYSLLADADMVEADEEAVIEAAAEIAQVKDIEQRGAALARELQGRIPLVFASSRNFAVARSWKIKLNETAKVQAFWHVLPEADHNAVNAFPDGGERFCYLSLDDDQDHERVRMRMDLTAKIAQANGMHLVRTPLQGSTRLARLLYGVWLGDWVALALADLRKADPAGTPIIDQLKLDLAS